MAQILLYNVGAFVYPASMPVDVSYIMRISGKSMKNVGSTTILSHPIYAEKSQKLIARASIKSFRQFQALNELLMLGNDPIEIYVYQSGSRWKTL